MRTVLIDGEKINYIAKEEVAEIKDMEYRNKLQNIYADAENISNLLRIRCPHITTAYICAAPDGSLQFGRKFLKSECQNLEKNMVILADVAFTNNETYIGTLAHELRHIWQSIYQPELYKTSAQGEAGLYSKGEIDADGFAFFYASKVLQKSIEEVDRKSVV